VPASWADAFEMLKRYLEEPLAYGERRVAFLDELPWLASPRSGFLSALDHFWNTFASRQRNLILVICGSAASWMIVNVLCGTGYCQRIRRSCEPAQEVSDLHSLAARKRLGEELGLGKPAPLDTPKNALRRLQKDELVMKLEYGHYQIQDEGFVEWLRQLELEE
jgi:hypothetical protein